MKKNKTRADIMSYKCDFMWREALSVALSAVVDSYPEIAPQTHNDMPAASLEEGINPRQDSSCRNEGIQGILPQSATFIPPCPLLSSPLRM